MSIFEKMPHNYTGTIPELQLKLNLLSLLCFSVPTVVKRIVTYSSTAKMLWRMVQCSFGNMSCGECELCGLPKKEKGDDTNYFTCKYVVV